VSKEKEAAAPKKSGVTHVRSVTGSGFRRSVRGEDGNILRTMEIPREGAFVVETDEDLAALIDDFRTEPNKGALIEVDENGKPLDKPSKALESARKERAEAQKKALEEKAKNKAARDNAAAALERVAMGDVEPKKGK
jgi:hypothetical protein